MKLSIGHVLVITLALGVTASQKLDSLAAGTNIQTIARPEHLIDIKAVLSGLSALTDSHIEAMANALTVVAESQDIRSLDWAQMKPLLSAVQERYGPANVWFARPDGTYFTVEKGLTDKSLKDRPYFPKVMAGEPSTGELVVSRATSGNTVITAVPIKKDGKVIGMLGASVYLDKLAQHIKTVIPLPAGVVFYALDSKGQIALHTKQELIFQEATKLGGTTLTAAVQQMLIKPP